MDIRIYGKKAIYPSDPAITQINDNAVIIGGTGSGKTMSIVEPQLLSANEDNYIITLSKKRLLQFYAPILKERGYNVEILNLCDSSESTVGYDPLHYISNTGDIRQLAESVVCANQGSYINNDPYWNNAAADLLSAEIELVRFCGKTHQGETTFSNVLDLHQSLEFKENNADETIDTSLDEQFESAAKEPENKTMIGNWRSFKNVPLKTAGCIYSTLNGAVSNMFDDNIKQIIDMENTFDVQKYSDRPSILFILTSPVNTAYHQFVSLFYGQIIKVLFEYAESLPAHRLPRHTQIIADDFATGAPIPHFYEYISIFREIGIGTTLLIQSEAQLASLYSEHEATTIMNNSDTLVFLGGNDFLTARNIAARLNLPTNDVLQFPIGKIAVIRRGSKPIITERYPILEDKQYQRMFNTQKEKSHLKEAKEIP